MGKQKYAIYWTVFALYVVLRASGSNLSIHFGISCFFRLRDYSYRNSRDVIVCGGLVSGVLGINVRVYVNVKWISV